MRVTVIATGLDGDRVRRGRDSVQDDRSNVTPLRLESATAERAPVSAEHSEPPPAEQTSMHEPQAPEARTSEEWISPFEDELDVPTFIRRGSGQDDEEEDRDRPAFLRRSAD